MAQALSEIIKKSPGGTVSLTELRDRQVELEKEAREILSGDISKCTYSLGPLNQSIYSCRTCAAAAANVNKSDNSTSNSSSNLDSEQNDSNDEYVGVCYACSVSCHTDHDLVELFTKRDFQCDCGTNRTGDHKCTLAGQEKENEATPSTSTSSSSNAKIRIARKENMYNHNFSNNFCYCNKAYDPSSEDEDMYQCLVCQDWFHESCIGVHPHPSDWDHMVCSKCVQGPAKETIGRWAGSNLSGFMIVDNNENVHGQSIQEDNNDPTAQQIIDAVKNGNDNDEEQQQQRDSSTLSASLKRKASVVQALGGKLTPESQDPINENNNTAKRQKLEGAQELEPKPEPEQEQEQPSVNVEQEEEQKPKTCTAPSKENILLKSCPLPFVFLEENFQSKWCRCSECLETFKNFPYLLEEEEHYEPPTDPDLDKSIMDPINAQMLDRLPRDKVIDGITAWNKMQSRFQTFLSEFAQQGKVVKDQDVKDFFDQEKQKLLRHMSA